MWNLKYGDLFLFFIYCIIIIIKCYSKYIIKREFCEKDNYLDCVYLIIYKIVCFYYIFVFMF